MAETFRRLSGGSRRKVSGIVIEENSERTRAKSLGPKRKTALQFHTFPVCDSPRVTQGEGERKSSQSTPSPKRVTFTDEDQDRTKNASFRFSGMESHHAVLNQRENTSHLNTEQHLQNYHGSQKQTCYVERKLRHIKSRLEDCQDIFEWFREMLEKYDTIVQIMIILPFVITSCYIVFIEKRSIFIPIQKNTTGKIGG